jgi:magnesium transporter
MAAPSAERSAARTGRLSRLFERLLGAPRPHDAAVDRPAAALRPSSVVDCAVYADGVRLPGGAHYAAALAEVRRRPRAFLWLGLHEPDPSEFAGVAREFGLHELLLHDATSAAHRPTIEQIGEVTLFSLRTARYVEHSELTEWSEVVETGHIVILIGPSFVLTVRYGPVGPLGSVRADLEKRRELLAQGPWAVAYAICDRMVGTYAQVAAHVERDLLDIEEGIFARDRSQHIAHIYQLKRELTEFKRVVVPLQRPLQALTDERAVVPTALRKYLRDAGNHLNRTVDLVNSYDDLLNSMLQARLAQVTVEQNNDMRKIASWAAMAAVQTTIAGIYGMNFDVMPELRWRYGYPAVLAVMLLAGVVLYRKFRRAGWL